MNDGAASLHCVAVRVAQLAADGTTPAGNTMVVSDALLKLDFNADIEAGPETITRNAAGALCVIYKLPDLIKRLQASIEFCSPDPELEALITGGTVFTSGGNVVGFQYPHIGVDPVPNGVSIEAWTHAIVGDHIDSALPYMHWVFPRGLNFHHTARTIDGTPMANTYDGFFNQNPAWGNGPANDWPWDSTAVAQWTRATSFPASTHGSATVPTQV